MALPIALALSGVDLGVGYAASADERAAMRNAARCVDRMISSAESGLLEGCVGRGERCSDGFSELSECEARLRKEKHLLATVLDWSQRSRLEEFLDALADIREAQHLEAADLETLAAAGRSTIHTIELRHIGERKLPDQPPESGVVSYADAEAPQHALTAPSGAMQASAEGLPPDSPEYLDETVEVQFTPALDAVIDEYQSDPVLLFHFARDEVDFRPYRGSKKRAGGVLDSLSGNEIDQASLLIAFYRRLGVPAR